MSTITQHPLYQVSSPRAINGDNNENTSATLQGPPPTLTNPSDSFSKASKEEQSPFSVPAVVGGGLAGGVIGGLVSWWITASTAGEKAMWGAGESFINGFQEATKAKNTEEVTDAFANVAGDTIKAVEVGSKTNYPVIILRHLTN